MVSRTQITLDAKLQKRARQKAAELGVSFAEYVRGLVTRDIERPESTADVECVFDLGSSGASDVAADKDAMIAEAIAAGRRIEAKR
jgi:hypothetical protein